MREFTLEVAGYRLRFGSVMGGPELTPGVRFTRNIVTGSGYDLFVRVHRGFPDLPNDMKRVFHAPLVEEAGGGPVKKLENFWSVYKHGSGLMLKTVFPRTSNTEMRGFLSYSLECNEWDLYIASEVDGFDPLEYPLDGLILYYLTVMNGDIFIHGSGVEHNGSGFLFTGISGTGKSTMASLWEKAGARVIHDDRLIIRKIESKFIMFNTPVYNDEEPRSAPLDHIFIIGHGMSNELVPMRGASALSHIMANCIQHNWSTDLIGQLTGSLYLLTQSVPVAAYWFKPDATAVSYILSHVDSPGR
jgi:hypothetical protein